MFKLIIGNTDMTAKPFRVKRVNLRSATTSEPKLMKLPRDDGSHLSFDRLKSRRIRVDGYILSPTKDEALEALDGLAWMNKQILPVTYNWYDAPNKDRVLDVLITAVEGPDSYEYQNHLPYYIIGTAPNPIARDANQTTGATVTGSGPNINAVVVAGGSYMGLPEITVTINSMTTTRDVNTITLTNTRQPAQMNITHPFKVGDVVNINCATKEVYIGGVPIDPRGRWLELLVGGYKADPALNTTTIKYADTFDTRNVTVKVNYFKRWQ